MCVLLGNFSSLALLYCCDSTHKLLLCTPDVTVRLSRSAPSSCRVGTSIQQSSTIVHLLAEMEMETICYQCSKPVKTLEYLQCGLCNKTTHLKCVGLKRSYMDFINEQKNVMWFCDKCTDQLKIMKDFPPITSKEIVTSVSQIINESLLELKNDLHETKELTKALAGKITSFDASSSAQFRSVLPRIKRPRETADRETPKARPTEKLIVGTKSVDKGIFTVDTIAKPPEKFWIYLSRIARHVTEADVTELVKVSLNTELPIDVKKLVRKDTDLEQLAFISFKVGVDKSLKNTALDSSVWPKGIYFREFKNLPSERDFWGPAKISKKDDGTPRVTGTPLTLTSAAITTQ